MLSESLRFPVVAGTAAVASSCVGRQGDSGMSHTVMGLGGGPGLLGGLVRLSCGLVGLSHELVARDSGRLLRRRRGLGVGVKQGLLRGELATLQE